jgi:hypothetical protein
MKMEIKNLTTTKRIEASKKSRVAAAAVVPITVCTQEIAVAGKSAETTARE